MASPCSSITVLIFLISSLVVSTSGEDSVFGVEMDRKLIMGNNREKLSHFRFYWHDILSGKNPSGVTVIPAANSSKTAFTLVRMFDNRLTIAPEIGSKLVGRAQGFYALASKEEVAALVTENLAFIEGKYNGSSITILGRNPGFNKYREMPVVGGSGLFRWARGYLRATTHMFDLKTGDATVEYNLYVLHY